MKAIINKKFVLNLVLVLTLLFGGSQIALAATSIPSKTLNLKNGVYDTIDCTLSNYLYSNYNYTCDKKYRCIDFNFTSTKGVRLQLIEYSTNKIISDIFYTRSNINDRFSVKNLDPNKKYYIKIISLGNKISVYGLVSSVSY